MVFYFFLPGVLVLATAFLLFDKILRFQYRNFPEEWEKQGKAIGFYWVPPNSSLFSGSFQRSVRFLSWTFGSEDWMATDPKIIKMIWVMRGCIFTNWLLAIPIIYFGLVA